ncbi:MAG: hypothetical protein IJ012_04100 [Clostridia bacterium]|nr:hypothetical protein [Clostridia bacterium]
MKKKLLFACTILLLTLFLFSCAPETPSADPPPEGIYVGMNWTDFTKQLPESADLFYCASHWCYINEDGKLIIVRTVSSPLSSKDPESIVGEIVVCDPPALQSRSDLQDRIQVGMTLIDLIKELGIPTTENVSGKNYHVFPLADEKELITYCEWKDGSTPYFELKEFWFEFPPELEGLRTTIQY